MVDSLKVIAMLTMLIDHIGAVFFPGTIVFRMIGRLSFPIFAWGIAKGYSRTSSTPKYMARIFLVAIISQLPYMHLFQVSELNILFTLLWGLMAIFVWQQISPLLALFLCLPAEGLVSYGLYGVIVILLFYVYRENRLAQFIAMLVATGIYSAFKSVELQLFAVLALPLINRLTQRRILHLPRYFAYFFYPAHLIILAAIRALK